MTSAHKKDFWQQHILAWEQSKIPQKVYCDQNNISYASFGYWRTRLNRLQKPIKKLVPVTLSRPLAVVVITLPMGIRIDVPADALGDVLPVVVHCQQEVS